MLHVRTIRTAPDGTVRRDLVRNVSHGTTLARLFTDPGAAATVKIVERSGDTVRHIRWEIND